MKKTIFALTVGAALGLTSAQAATVLYGSVRIGVDYAENHTSYLPESQAMGWKSDADPLKGRSGRDDGFDVVDTGTRFGIKGEEDLGNGLSGIFKLEFGYDGVEGINFDDERISGGSASLSNRLAFVGLKSESVGTVVIGKIENPFDKVVVGHAGDVMNEAYTAATSMAAGYALYGGYAQDGGVTDPATGIVYPDKAFPQIAKLPSRIGNTVAYMSPDFNGFNFNVAAIMDEGTLSTRFGDGNKNADAYTINLGYKSEMGLSFGLGYMGAKRVGHRLINSFSINDKIFGGNIGYENDFFKVGVAYVQAKSKQEVAYDAAKGWIENDVKATGWDLGGQVKITDNSFINARYGQMKGEYKKPDNIDVNGNGMRNQKVEDEITTWALGFEHRLSERTRAWIEYEKQEYTQKDTTTTRMGIDETTQTRTYADSKRDRFNIGVRHDF